MKLSTATSPNSCLVAIHVQPREANPNRLIIKCYDSHVSVGSLKFTLSANSNAKSFAGTHVTKLQFTSNECLLALISNGTILVFDLNRGVHSQTIDATASTSNGSGDVCAVTGKDHLVYTLVRIEGKLFVFVFNLEKDGKFFKKIKGLGSCDEDDRLGIAVYKEDMIAVCIGKVIKIKSLGNAETISKCKIKSKDDGKDSLENNGSILDFSVDGKMLIACDRSGAYAFEVKGGNRVGSFKATDINTVQICSNDETYIAAVVCNKSKVSLVEINTSNDKKSTLQTFATVTLPASNVAAENSTIINDAFFSSGKKAKSEIMTLELTPQGINNADVIMNKVTYKDASNKLQSGELYPTTIANEGGGESSKESEGSKKRKSPSTNVVLGPGESGGEAMDLTDGTTVKRPKTADDSDDEDYDNYFELEEDGEAEETIAQKLALLSSELDRDTEDEEELLKIQDQASNKFIVKTATSESLSILLRQSLMANDDAQLEVALQVSDKGVIQNSIFGLANESLEGGDDNGPNGEIIIMLLTKLVTRLSRKPSRAQKLAFWVRIVLVALISKIGSSSTMEMGKVEKEIASRLGPLRNMLSERVESLPELLRLEGRLSLLNNSKF